MQTQHKVCIPIFFWCHHAVHLFTARLIVLEESMPCKVPCQEINAKLPDCSRTVACPWRCQFRHCTATQLFLFAVWLRCIAGLLYAQVQLDARDKGQQPALPQGPYQASVRSSSLALQHSHCCSSVFAGVLHQHSYTYACLYMSSCIYCIVTCARCCTTDKQCSNDIEYSIDVMLYIHIYHRYH